MNSAIEGIILKLLMDDRSENKVGTKEKEFT